MCMRWDVVCSSGFNRFLLLIYLYVVVGAIHLHALNLAFNTREQIYFIVTREENHIAYLYICKAVLTALFICLKNVGF